MKAVNQFILAYFSKGKLIELCNINTLIFKEICQTIGFGKTNFVK